MQPPSTSRWIQLALIPVLFYFGVKLSLAFAVLPEVVVVLWLPNSLLVVTLLHYGARRFVYFAPLILVAEIAADYPTFSVVEAILFGVINLFEAVATTALLRRWKFDTRFIAPLDLVKFIVAGPVIAAFAAAMAAAEVYSFFRGIETGYFEFLRIWWFSDGMGLLILTPFVLGFWPALPAPERERVVWRWYDSLVIAAGLVVIAAFLSSYQGNLAGVPIRVVLLLPMVLYVAGRFGVRETALALVAVSAVVIYAAKSGRQPFGAMPVHQTVLSVQEFIFTMTVMALGLTSLLSQLRTTTRELEARVRDRTAELSTLNTQLQQLAVTDSLTGLPNRRMLFDVLRREMSRERRYGHTLTAIMFDIDHFKEVNDRFGHATGDRVLQHVADIASKLIRGLDTIARYGGEEFVIVLPDTDKSEGVRLAERMLAALRASETHGNEHLVRVTASFGVATLRPQDTEAEELLRRADAALYAAKTAGRNRVFADPD